MGFSCSVHKSGGVGVYKQISPTIKAEKVCAGVVEMNLTERIDEMYRQLETTNPKSRQKIRDLKRGIERAEKKRRKEKRGGTIVI